MSISTIFIVLAVVLFVLEGLGIKGGLAIWGLASFAAGHLPLPSLRG
jgi:hypothetical protein